MAEQGDTKKKGSLGKKLGIGLGVVVVLLVAGGIVLMLTLNGLVRAGVEAGGSYALGTSTTLKSADVGLLSGRLAFGGLSVANPQGFKSPEFLGLGNAGMQVSLGSLRDDTIEVPQIKLETIRVSLERANGRTNYETILEHVKKAAGDSKPSSAGSGPSKKFIVREIEIRDVKVHVDLLGTGGALDKAASLDVPIDEIRLTNVGNAKDGGVDVATLASVVVHAVLSAASAKGQGILPDDLLNDLNSRLSGLGAQLSQVKGLGDAGVAVVGKLGAGAQEVVGKLGGDLQKALGSGTVKDIGTGVEGAAKDLGKAAEGAAKEVEGALKGILPGKKDEKKTGPK